METRSQKRAEASSSAAPSQFTGPATRSSKRARISSPAPPPPPPPSSSTVLPATRSRNLSSSIFSMDSSNESLTVAGSRRRGKNQVSEANTPDKGKEKEHEVRVRARDKDLVLNAEGIGLDEDDEDEDDDYSEGGVGILHHNLTSASSALQGLLKKLGAGLDDLLPSSGSASASFSHNNGRFKKILSGLRADGEEGRQIEALSQLCDMILLMGTEDSLSSTLSVDSFVPVLVGLLNHERNPDIMLLAARAITHLCDFLPSSCAAVVHYGAVSHLCERLLTIEYMDLAEQCLQALKKISLEHPTACLRAGALMAVLSYLDFFPTGVQRVALSTAANICKKLPPDASDLAMEVVPILTNLLQYHDTKVLEDASICLTRIAESLLAFPDKLDEICNGGLVAQAVSLVSTSSIGGGQSSLSSLTYTGLIRLLFAFASGSPLGAKTLLLLGISGILKDALSVSGTTSSSSVSPALNRPPNQVFEIVNLANELLPPLPQGVISFSPVACSKGPFLKKSPTRATEKQEIMSGNGSETSAREKLLNDQPDILKQFGMDLLSVLIQIYGSSVNSPVRHKCLSVIGKLMYFSTADMIQPLITQTNIPSFLAGILAWKDPQVLVPALQIAEILMEKLPETFSKLFVKEGVVHAVDAIISSGSPNTVLAQGIVSDKSNEPGTSLRSSRYRRRSGISTSDINHSEESKSSAAVCVDSLPLNAADIPTANANLGSTICSRAKVFKTKYFPTSRGTNDVGVTDDFLRLKNFSTKLSVVVDDLKNKSKGKSKAHGEASFEKEKILMDMICDMLDELNRGDGVSTFEFIGSGVVTALLNYFSCGHFFKEKVSDSNIPIFRQQALKRFKSFVRVALSSSDSAVGRDSLMAILIQKLQKALSSLDCFPVVLSHSCRLSTGTQPSIGLSSLSSLSQPFKLRLCREQGDKSLRDFSSNIVLIDPLASIASIEDFLLPRVQCVEPSLGNSDPGNTSSGVSPCSPSMSTPALPRRQSNRSRSSLTISNTNKQPSREKYCSNSKGKGKVTMKPMPEQSGPQTRNAIRRKAALGKDTQGTHGGDSSSEELGISPCDIDGALVIEDENISDDEHVEVLGEDLLPMCAPGAVHDVKLGDMAEDNATAPSTSTIHAGLFSGGIRRTSMLKGLDSYDFRNGGLFGSHGAMSFAAAAMAGLSSSNGRSIKGDGDNPGRSDPPRLKLSAGGKTLNRHMTIYQAIQRQLVTGDEDDDKQLNVDLFSNGVSKLWSDVYTITYQRYDARTDKASSAGGTPPSAISAKLCKTVSPCAPNSCAPATRASLLDSMVQGELPCDLERSNPTYNILALLRVLEGVNQLAPRLQVEAIMDSFAEGRILNLDGLNTHFITVPCEEFVNSKLTPKLTRQIQDALALCSRSLPQWCYQLTKACPFLFPFETRRQYFYSTAFGLPHALYRLQQQQGADGHGSSHDRGGRFGRLERQKVRVSRNHILDSAMKVMEMYSSQKSLLEVEYFGEVGTGLGPTLEFYTLLSHDFRKAALGLWRCDEFEKNSAMEMDGDGFEDESKKNKGKSGPCKLSTDDIVKAPLGLFPRPWSQDTGVSDGTPISKVAEYFHLLGRVMAKALQDGRLLDLPISTGLYKILLGHELDLHDVFSFDAELGKTLRQFQALVYRKNYLESVGSGGCDALSSLSFHGVPIKDLCLDFTLPGYPDYVLKSGDEYVDINNLEEYVSLVVDATVKTGIKAQVEALRAGFNQVFDVTSLQIFSPHELDNLLCGLRDSWESETLTDYIKFDHGFTAKSPPIINLLEIMGEFTGEQQRAFCRFVTGAPRLPPGGLAVLNPKLTIVRKNPTSNSAEGGNGSVDNDLPSVMTCANYLKLPPYTTKEIMYNKLIYAITEGQGSFDLS